MGKPKEKAPTKLPNPDEVADAKPLVEQVARAKQRLAKVSTADVAASDPKRRAARKRVKRAQRRLRRTLAYAAARPQKPAAASEAAAESPAGS